MSNYFNTLTFIKKLEQLKKCRFMNLEEFSQGIKYLSDKKVVIVGCGSQGLNQGLNMRDSGVHIVYALRTESIVRKGPSWKRAVQHGFSVGTYEEVIPTADLVINLTPDKNHSSVVKEVQPLMKGGSALGYSHGFNIVEIGEKIRKDITVIMVAPKCPGTEVRQEYQRGFGVPSLIAVHQENDFYGKGIEIAKAWAFSLGSHRAGVLESSFIAEVKSDLMGEQTILCGMLQSGSILCFDKMIDIGVDPGYAAKLVQYGWEVITESLKQGGITLMMDRLSNSSKLRAYILAEKLKHLLKSIFENHMENIISGHFSKEMCSDWRNNDKKLLEWRDKIRNSSFEQAPVCCIDISEQTYFDHGLLMVAIIKSGIELSFEIMIKSGISPESAYYESLHELPLIANTISRKRLYEMNLVISDTAEYGSYLFSETVIPFLKKTIMSDLEKGDLGTFIKNSEISNVSLRDINESIRFHPIEKIGIELRKYMKKMKSLKFSR